MIGLVNDIVFNSHTVHCSVFFIAALVWLFMSLVIRIISAMAGNLFEPSLVVMWPPDVT